MVENSSHENEGIIVCSLNPFMAILQFLDLCRELVKKFPMAKMRTEGMCKLLQNTLSGILDKLHEPHLIMKLLQKRDLAGSSCLDLLAKLELYRVLQSKVVYRILTMQWESSVDTSSSFLNSATSYRAFKNINFV